MKQLIIILTIIVIAFSLGWWTNEMWRFAEGVADDARRADSLRKLNSPQFDSIRTMNHVQTNKKTIHDYISDQKFIKWETSHIDTTDYLCELSLHKKTVLFWFHGQCGYDYFTNIISDSTIDMLWSYNPDCILNMSFLKKSNGVKKYPKCGDTFATFRLKNDTTLYVKYYFPEWIKKVNEITQDSLFPTYFFLLRDN